MLIRTPLINDSSMLTANQVSMTSIFLIPVDVNYWDIFKNCIATCCWTLYIVPPYLRLLRMNSNILKVYKRHSPKNIKKKYSNFSRGISLSSFACGSHWYYPFLDIVYFNIFFFFFFNSLSGYFLYILHHF